MAVPKPFLTVFGIYRRWESCVTKIRHQYQSLRYSESGKKRMAWLHILESDLTRWQLEGISIWPRCQWQSASLPALSWPTCPTAATGTLQPWPRIFAPTRRTRVTGTASYPHPRGYIFTNYPRIWLSGKSGLIVRNQKVLNALTFLTSSPSSLILFTIFLALHVCA